MFRPHESQAATREADILVLFDSKNRHIGVPAKLYEYLGARSSGPRTGGAGWRYGTGPAAKWLALSNRLRLDAAGTA